MVDPPYPGGLRGLQHSVSLPDDEMIAADAEGCYIETTSGERYVDYMLGSGAVICGHAHPAITEAIQDQAARTQTPILATEPGIELAHRLTDAIPCADQVIFTCTGSQGVFFAVRLARAYTGRRKVLKFEGAYHGYHDAVLKGTSWGPREEMEYPDGTVDSAGILSETAEHTLIAPFNDLDRTRDIVAEYADDLATVIVEPIHRSIPPADGFLSGLREICNDHGVVLIFDEIVTGFRIAWGGAQERYDVTPDLAVYGKTMTGGAPVGAVGGDVDIMRLAGPDVSVEESGVLVGSTMNGNAMCAAAANATLEVISEDGGYDALEDYADRFRAFIAELFTDHGVPVTTIGDGAIIDFAITEVDELTDWRASLRSDTELQREIEQEVMNEGVLLFTGSKKYISLAHHDEAFEQTKEAYKAAMERVEFE